MKIIINIQKYCNFLCVSNQNFYNRFCTIIESQILVLKRFQLFDHPNTTLIDFFKF